MNIQSMENHESAAAYSRIREYMSVRRMCSAESLKLKFNIEFHSLWQVLEMLKSDSIIRIVHKSRPACCASGCNEHTADSSAIIISLDSNRNVNVSQ